MYSFSLIYLHQESFPTIYSFHAPSTFRLADKHSREREDTHDSKARNFTWNRVTILKF
jgi:hypothetical protein